MVIAIANGRKSAERFVGAGNFAPSTTTASRRGALRRVGRLRSQLGSGFHRCSRAPSDLARAAIAAASCSGIGAFAPSVAPTVAGRATN